MKKSTIVLLLACAVVGTQAVAQESALGTPFKLADKPEFGQYQTVLKHYALKHRPGARNDFCVVGYLDQEDTATAWIIWQQGQKMLAWEGGEPDLDFINNVIDLRKDVVKSSKDLHGSTYQVTRQWVAQLKRGCQQEGVNVHFSAAELKPEPKP